MSRKVVNCPYCGKILPVDTLGKAKAPIPEAVKCPICEGRLLHRDGFRQKESGRAQRYLCRKCGYRFSVL